MPHTKQTAIVDSGPPLPAAPASPSLAAYLASKGKDVMHDSLANFLMGWKPMGGGLPWQQPAQAAPPTPAPAPSPQPQPQPQPQPRPRPATPKAVDRNTIIDGLMNRVWTNQDVKDQYGGVGVLAQPGAGMIPAAALRPEIRGMFDQYGGAFAVDIRGLSPDEQNALKSMLDPEWVQAHVNPGANLTEAEKAQAQARYQSPSS